MGAKVLLRQSYRDGGIGWQVQFWVSFSPVSMLVSRKWKRGRGRGVCLLDDCDVDRCSCAGLVDFWICHLE